MTELMSEPRHALNPATPAHLVRSVTLHSWGLVEASNIPDSGDCSLAFSWLGQRRAGIDGEVYKQTNILAAAGRC